ncbi:hypothetical protein [Deinococcus sp. NW-56]|uniref:hypothetical protein n=1 Tax=Deinococcus sp. NW-56 TaxID=2080419 RepID=UPI000CF3B852|nr:hypothetical protein [Deinococcus sp. NW-56]
MYRMKIGGVDLRYLPAVDGVSLEGGGRPVAERVALDGRIIATRPPLPTSRRLTITAPEGFVISAQDAEAIRALGDGPFDVTLAGYEPSGTFTGCTFEEPPRFPPTSDPRYRSYAMTIYIPQQGGA